MDWPAGDYELLVRVDGGTFKRQQRTKIRIYGAPFAFAGKLGADGQTIDVDVTAAADLVDLASLSGIVVVARPDESNEVFDLPAFDGSRFLSVQAKPLAAEVTAGAELPSATPAPMPEPAPLPSIDWLMSSALVLGGNVFVGLLLAGVWFAVGRRRTAAASEVVLQ